MAAAVLNAAFFSDLGKRALDSGAAPGIAIAAVTMLADDGKLSFDDRLAKYAPFLPNAKEITLRMLLDQTSGLHNYGAPELPAISLDLYSGAGVASAHHLALWDGTLLRGTLLGKSYLDRIWNDSVPTGDGARRYSMGWEIIRDADGLGIVVLTNGFGATGLPERIVQSIAAAYFIGASPAPVVAATAAPGDDPAIDARVRAFWNQLASGDVDRSALTSDFAALLTPEYLSQVRVGIELLGELRSFTFMGTRQAQNATIYRYALDFTGGVEHEWDVAITTDGKIAGSRLVR
jgi:Beta-lactamase